MIPTTVAAAVMFVAGAVAVAVALVSHDRNVPMSAGLTVTAVGVTGRVTVELLVLAIGRPPILEAVGTIFSAFVVVGWVYLIACYTDNEWAVRDGRILLVAAPLVVGAIVLWADVLVGAGGGTERFRSVVEGTVVLFSLYSYFLTATTIVALLVRFVREPPIYRRRAALLAVAPLPPALVAIGYGVGVVESGADLTMAGYAVSVAIALFALQRYDLLEIVPLARETTVNTIEDGVIAVTNDGVVASVNDPGMEMLGMTDDDVGRDVADGLAGWPALVDAIAEGEEPRLRLDDDHVAVSLTPIEKRGVRLGTVVHLKDVTTEVRRSEELREKHRELRRTNEQLEQFASVVSHDIRNPLNVAQGHLDVIAADANDESVEAIAEAHDRIDAIVSDLLALARQGRRVSDPTEVNVERVAWKAQATTALPEGGLEFVDPGTVQADPARFQQLLENLFRNAVEHSSTSPGSHARQDAPEPRSSDVTVRVGSLAGASGFYVEDNGPGIPPSERDSVFEYGHTNRKDGTGLGLSIVESIADAHGWEVRIVDGADGGARFEFYTGGETGADDEGVQESSTG